MRTDDGTQFNVLAESGIFIGLHNSGAVHFVRVKIQKRKYLQSQVPTRLFGNKSYILPEKEMHPTELIAPFTNI